MVVALHWHTLWALIAPREIECLPDQVINQIAAGEVVERPFSVVKELVENSIDAGSSHIAIEIDKGGTSKISVMDNGRGMRPDQVLLAMKRHATSKLKQVEDLFTLSTFGFRGEALPSIASVSKTQLSTKTASADVASVFHFEGGTLVHEDVIGAPNGTRIVVNDLFFNVPARKKFLRTISTEAAHVHRTICQLAIANPNIHFTLQHNGRQVILAPKQETLRKRVETLWGRYLGDNYGFANESLAGIKVQAFIGASNQWLSTTKGILLFVNNRAVKDKAILSTLLNATKTSIGKDGYPTCVLFIDIPKDTMDINVHPQKTEIRFSDIGRVLAAVRYTIREAISSLPEVPMGDAIRHHAAGPLNARRQYLRDDLVKRHEVSWAKTPKNPTSKNAYSHAHRPARTYNAERQGVGFPYSRDRLTTPQSSTTTKVGAFQGETDPVIALRLLGETSYGCLCLESTNGIVFVKRALAQALLTQESLLKTQTCLTDAFLFEFEIPFDALARTFNQSEIEALNDFGFAITQKTTAYGLTTKPLGFCEDNIKKLFVDLAKTSTPLNESELSWLLALYFYNEEKKFSESKLLASLKRPEFWDQLSSAKGVFEVPLEALEKLYDAP